MKPIGRKSYGSIPHLPDSRMGPGDHHCAPGQATIATERTRDRHDVVLVQEKLDGSCCAVARTSGDGTHHLVALGRAGYLADTSRFEQHHLFARWVDNNRDRFYAALQPGQRLVGEWLAQAHGTRYELSLEPFAPFDLMEGEERLGFAATTRAVQKAGLIMPALLGIGPPMTVEAAMERLGQGGFHGAIDPVEGAIWRVEREGKVDFVAKYVRPDKVDGAFLPRDQRRGAHLELEAVMEIEALAPRGGNADIRARVRKLTLEGATEKEFELLARLRRAFLDGMVIAYGLDELLSGGRVLGTVKPSACWSALADGANERKR